ncbi:MAG: sulfotransferase [Pseudomonadota bacterium]
MSAPSFFQQAVGLHKAGRLRQAIEAYRAHLKRGPDANGEHYLGLALVQAGQIETGLTHLRAARSAQPHNAMFLTNLGKALLNSPHVEEARDTFARCVILNARDADSWNNLAGLERRLGDLEAALEAYRQALALKAHPAIALNLGLVAKDAGHRAEAADAFEKTLELDPKSVRAHVQLAAMETEDGRFEAAQERLLSAYEIDPSNARTLAALLTLRSYMPEDGVLAAAEQVLRRSKADAEEAIRLKFGLARAYQRREQHDRAWEFANSANKDVAKTAPYSAELLLEETIRLETAFTPEIIEFLRSARGDGEGLVFVVGLPRTGTTLVEQILSSHPDVFGADERPEIPALAAGLNTDQHAYPDDLGRVPVDWLTDWVTGHEAKMAALAPDAVKVVDKLPFNFSHLGLIAGLFPKASIVHCTRDLRDVFVSCFFTEFTSELQAFRTSPGNFAHYAKMYQRLMTHWEGLFGERIHTVRYEDMVADFDAQARVLLEKCGLEWHEDCERFFETQRTVRTPSRWQVRQPLYSSSVERWRAYETHLGPVAAL